MLHGIYQQFGKKISVLIISKGYKFMTKNLNLMISVGYNFKPDNQKKLPNH